MAIGLIEIEGYAAALVVGDAAAKAAQIEIMGMEATRPADARAAIPLTVLLKMRGDVSQIQAAIEAGEYAAKRMNREARTHIIAKIDEQLEPELLTGQIKKRR